MASDFCGEQNRAVIRSRLLKCRKGIAPTPKDKSRKHMCSTKMMATRAASCAAS